MDRLKHWAKRSAARLARRPWDPVKAAGLALFCWGAACLAPWLGLMVSGLFLFLAGAAGSWRK